METRNIKHIIYLFGTASATQEDNVQESKSALDESTTSISAVFELTTNGIKMADLDRSSGGSQQSSLDKLLARSDREQNVSNQRSEETVKALAQVLINQVIVMTKFYI